MQGFDRHQAAHRSTFERGCKQHMLHSLFLPILQSLQTTAVADAMSGLGRPATLCLTKGALQVGLQHLQQTTALAQAQLLADE